MKYNVSVLPSHGAGLNARIFCVPVCPKQRPERNSPQNLKTYSPNEDTQLRYLHVNTSTCKQKQTTCRFSKQKTKLFKCFSVAKIKVKVKTTIKHCALKMIVQQ